MPETQISRFQIQLDAFFLTFFFPPMPITSNGDAARFSPTLSLPAPIVSPLRDRSLKYKMSLAHATEPRRENLLVGGYLRPDNPLMARTLLHASKHRNALCITSKTIVDNRDTHSNGRS